MIKRQVEIPRRLGWCCAIGLGWARWNRRRCRRATEPLVLISAVFVVNLLETWAETTLRERWGLGQELGFQLARAAHWFEGSRTVEVYDVVSPIVVYGFSFSYFFALLFLVLLTGWGLARRTSSGPFRVFAYAIAADSAISLPFFIFFPVPERWAYPGSGAILLSDLWAPKLIELFRPISGLDNCFPSFHVSLTVVTVALCFVFRMEYRWSALWIGLLIVLSTWVLGIHWATDLVAGAAAGTLAATLALALNSVSGGASHGATP